MNCLQTCKEDQFRISKTLMYYNHTEMKKTSKKPFETVDVFEFDNS